MPEGDTIFRTARALSRALAGKTVTRFETGVARLAAIDADRPVAGRTVELVEAHGKWLLISFSGDLILLSHLLMNGRWHIYRVGEHWRRRRADMRILIETDDWLAVGFSVPVAEFHSPTSLRRRMATVGLGPDLLKANFRENEALSRICEHASEEIATVLLDQRVMAGMGNVFKSEICFACGISPFRHVEAIEPSQMENIVYVSRKFLRINVDEATGSVLRRTTGSLDREARLWVYGRRGEPCRRCGTPIESCKQGAEARVTFWCPQCQII